MKIRFWLLAVAGLLTGAVVLLLWLSPRVANHQPADPASAWQPIVVTFNRPIRSDSADGRLTIEPPVAGASRVEGQQLIFEPARPLAYNQRYTVTLEAGVTGQNRLPMLLSERWSFELAPPQLIYLLEQDGRVNLWRRADDGPAEQLTDEAAGVWDYAPLPNGRGLVYSALDPDDDTVDLAYLSHDGQTEPLLDCQDALCRAPAPQPGGKLIAYERLPLGAGLNASELWLLDSESGQTQPAPVPAALADAGFDAPVGRHARWSVDGRRLASYRPDANMIVILDFGAPEPAEPLTIPANLEAMAGWSPDGRSLAYTETAFGQTGPHEHVDESGTVISHTRPSLYEHVVIVDVDGGDASDISAGLEIDEGRPAWHPSGELLAIPRSSTGAGKQLFLVSPDGREVKQLTDDPFHNHSALAWSPDGRYLAFMRLPRFDGASTPTVILYDMENDQEIPVADGAFLPGWWP